MSPNYSNPILGIIVDDPIRLPVNLADEEAMKTFLEKHPAEQEAENSVTIRFFPDDQARPWRDFRVQNAARRFLRQVVLPDWIQNHPHDGCSNIRVDEWGRLLCRCIMPVGPVDGPWENPTHFLFYAYNQYQVEQYYGTTLNTFIRNYCQVEGPLPS